MMRSSTAGRSLQAGRAEDGPTADGFSFSDELNASFAGLRIGEALALEWRDV